MTDTKTIGQAADPLLFSAALKQAAEHGIQGYDAWKASIERKDRVPAWYWNEAECKRRYVRHVQAALDWQAKNPPQAGVSR